MCTPCTPSGAMLVKQMFVKQVFVDQCCGNYTCTVFSNLKQPSYRFNLAHYNTELRHLKMYKHRQVQTLDATFGAGELFNVKSLTDARQDFLVF